MVLRSKLIYDLILQCYLRHSRRIVCMFLGIMFIFRCKKEYCEKGVISLFGGDEGVRDALGGGDNGNGDC